MAILYDVVVLLHFVSWALVLGFAVAGMRARTVPRGLMHSAAGALLTGLLIVGLREMGDMPVNHLKVGVKLLLALVIAILAWRAEKRQDGASLGPLAGLTLGNMAVAVLV